MSENINERINLFDTELKLDDNGNFISSFMDAECDEVKGKVFDYYIDLDTKKLNHIHIDRNMIYEMINMMDRVENFYKKNYDTTRI